MEGAETLYLQNHSQVSVVGGAQLNGQTELWDTISNKQVQPVKVTSPGDPLASIAAPTSGTVVSKSPVSYDMNNKPANDTLSPGVYCGGLTIGNTNGATFTMSPGVYIMAGGGLVLNSQAVVKGTGVTVYNTSSAGWGCSKSYSYTPMTISGQVTATLSAPTSGALDGILFFGNRTGCAMVGSCQDQINGGSTVVFNGALYFKSDQITITGGSSASGYLMLVADKIDINGNSTFGITGDPFDNITVSVSPSTSLLYAGQTQQFTATTNSADTAVTWTISPSGVGTVSASGLYTAPATISAQQMVTVTATSHVDTSKSASATVTLEPPVTVSVSPATATLYGGQTAQLTATVTNTSNMAVAWTISPAGVGTVSAAGLYTAPATISAQQTVKVTATSQEDASKSASATVTLMPKTNPTITWAPPAAISYGTALSATQLDATASVQGTFAYTPTSGVVLTAGSQTLSATFTPTVTAEYNTVTASVRLTVNQAAQTINFTPPASPVTYGVAPIALTATASSGLPVTFSVLSGPGTISNSTLTITGAGTVVVAANQAGNTNYAAAVQVTQSVTVNSAQCGSSGYTYRRVLTIDHTRVPNTDQTDYPMLVSGVYPFLATVANGGKVQNANGYDIVFTSDAAGQSPLDFEIDSYNGANGTAAFWVRIPSLSHTVDTTIYMWYGNSNISSTQENIAGVWRNNYLSVYHLGNGTSIGTADSGSAGYTLAQSGYVSPVTGVIGGGAAFNGDPGSYLYHDSVTAYPSGSTGQETLEAWAQFPANSGGVGFGYGANSWNGSRIALDSLPSGSVIEFENIGMSDPALINNNWHHLAGTYAGGEVTATTTQLYLDGIPLTGNDNNAGNVNIATNELKLGGIPTVTFCCGSTGSLDEVRISSVVRSADWIATEFNNESSPSTFYQLSDENEVSITPTNVILYNSQTQQFSANSCSGSITWSLTPAGVGTLTTSGFYTAPASIATQQTVTVTAADPANPAGPASATITLDPSVAVSVTPASVTLYSGQSQQFSATVLYTGNTTVNWTISPSDAGSISATGLFTATSSLATGQTVTVTATSQADPTKSATATVTLSPLPCPSTGYRYERWIQINHAMVPNTDQANFPILISGTYPFLATVANGGQVENANGYDIMFSSDAAGHNKLDYEIDSYNGTTGAVAYWVRMPLVSHTNDTSLYMW
jgi:hypothetical protein